MIIIWWRRCVSISFMVRVVAVSREENEKRQNKVESVCFTRVDE